MWTGNAVPNIDQVVIFPFPFVIWGANELRKVVVRRKPLRLVAGAPGLRY